MIVKAKVISSICGFAFLAVWQSHAKPSAKGHGKPSDKRQGPSDNVDYQKNDPSITDGRQLCFSMHFEGFNILYVKSFCDGWGQVSASCAKVSMGTTLNTDYPFTISNPCPQGTHCTLSKTETGKQLAKCVA